MAWLRRTVEGVLAPTRGGRCRRCTWARPPRPATATARRLSCQRPWDFLAGGAAASPSSNAGSARETPLRCPPGAVASCGPWPMIVDRRLSAESPGATASPSRAAKSHGEGPAQTRRPRASPEAFDRHHGQSRTGRPIARLPLSSRPGLGLSATGHRPGRATGMGRLSARVPLHGWPRHVHARRGGRPGSPAETMLAGRPAYCLPMRMPSRSRTPASTASRMS